MVSFTAQFEMNNIGFDTSFGEVTNTLNVEFLGELPSWISYYEGEYHIVPKDIPQELDTYNKILAEDVVVLEVPRHDVSNIDGTTVIIGGVPYYGK